MRQDLSPGIKAVLLGGIGTNALFAYGRPAFLFDTVKNQYAVPGSGVYNTPPALPGWTFARASTGYAQTSGGVLIPFASGVPRITDKGLLIEGARTNLCLRSQEPDNASWAKSDATVTATSSLAPDGTQTAQTFTDSTSPTSHYIASPSATFTSGTTYVGYAIVKAGTDSRVQLTFSSSTFSGVGYANFDLNAGTIVGSGGTLAGSGIMPLASGFYLCWISAAATATTTGSLVLARISAAGSTRVATYAGTSTTIILWGSQIEAAAFPSSYIPTTTASVTRAADVASIAVSGLAYPLTLFAEFELNTITSGSDIIGLDTLTNGAGIYDVNGVTDAWVRTASVTTANVPGGVAVLTAGVTRRAAARMQNDNVNASYGGAIGAADTAAGLSYTPTTLKLFGSVFGGQGFGYLKRAAIWPTAFSNTNLQIVST